MTYDSDAATRIQRRAEELAAEMLARRMIGDDPAGAPALPADTATERDQSSDFRAHTGYRTITPVPSPSNENPASGAPLNPQGGAPDAAPADAPDTSPEADSEASPRSSSAQSPSPAAPGDSGTSRQGSSADTPPSELIAADLSQRRLADAFEVLSRQESWSPSTRSEYLCMLTRWREFHRGSDPPVDQITEDMLREFFSSVDAWQAWRTRNKHLTYLTKILQAVAPRTGRTRYGMRMADAWIAEVPYIRIPKPARPTTTQSWRSQVITVEDIGRMYAVASTLPDAIRWQTLLVMAWCYGPRRTDLMLMPWSAVDWEDGTLSYIESKCGHPIGPLPLPDYVQAHLRACSKARYWKNPETILGFTWNDVRKGANNVYPTLYTIYQRAEVPVPVNRADRRQPLHGLRSACITNWKGHAAGLQRFVTGHSHGNVSDEHYARVGNLMRDAFPSLPVPQDFRNGPGQVRRIRKRRKPMAVRRRLRRRALTSGSVESDSQPTELRDAG